MIMVGLYRDNGRIVCHHDNGRIACHRDDGRTVFCHDSVHASGITVTLPTQKF